MLAVLGGSHAGAALEVAVEVLAALETKAIGHLAYQHIGRLQLVLSDVDNLLLNELQRRFACLLLHQVAKVVRRQAALVGKRFHRWHFTEKCASITET